METWIVGQDTPEQVCSYLTQELSLTGEAIYCFDYFDTLVVREIEPEYTKQLAARLLSQAMAHAVPADTLYGIRQDLERKLCDERAAAGGELEFYLPEFAEVFLERLQEKYSSLAGWDQGQFVRLILDIELAVELAVQSPCEETIAVLGGLKERKKTTVLISDFYLPGTHFRRMLHHFDLHDQFNHIFISSDYGLAKGSGRLYEKVCADLDCDPGQMVMIGDNVHSDVRMAREKGIKAIHLQNPVQGKRYDTWQPQHLSAADRVIRRFAAASDSTGPFAEMSSSLWYFTWLLMQRLMEQKAKNVFFFSKEGEFLKKLFDRLQQDLYGDSVVTSHYLLVSRKATFLASLRPLAEEDFARLFNHYRDISLRDFLLSLNLEESVAAGICEELGQDFKTRLPDLGNSPQFAALKQSPRFQKIYESRRMLQRKNCLRYLKSFDVDYENQGLTIVDVGWKGSIQDNIYHILEGQVRVQGYYVGSLIATEKKENNRKKGLIFDDTPAPSPYFHVYNNNRSLFEMLLGASHGSADGYFTRQQFASLPADHHKKVQKSITTDAGELCVATLDLPEERRLFEEVIRQRQECYFEVMIRLNRAYVRSGCSLPSPEWFARQHARMVFKPTREEVDFFESLYHLENFGIFEYTNFRAGEKLSPGQRYKNLKNILRDRQILESGIWPPIILRRLGIDIYRHVDGYRRFSKAFLKR